MELDRLLQIEKEIISGLKDFQKATVDRIYELFRSNKQEKVLIADEVGLGKTLIARGVVARLARHCKEQGAETFRVTYICSNLSIARQNMEKFRIEKVKNNVDKDAFTRLSMQVLSIFELRKQLKQEDGYIQLNAMTPATSFRLTNGAGTYLERALIYAILKKTKLFDDHIRELEEFLRRGVKSWTWAKPYMVERVENLEAEFEEQVISRVRGYLQEEDAALLRDILSALDFMRDGNLAPPDNYIIIGKLRWMMAVLSLEFLQPDLVIMDEFQRFRDLIKADKESEMGMLTDKFIHQTKAWTMLLSATPYKLYSTLEEIEEQANEDDHYREFWEVVDFLFRNKPEQNAKLKESWSTYSEKLRLLDRENLEQVKDYKQQVETILFEAMCRTERMQVSAAGDAMLDTRKSLKPVKVTDDDIRSYLSAARVTEELQEYRRDVPQPVEYVKSAPYILSFMEHYKLKRELKRAYQQNPELEKQLKKNRNAWLKRSDFHNYKRIQFPNARLRQLEKEAFSDNGAKLLWVPPALPYYEPGGPFRQNNGFSKILVFSAWTMVPRMIATLISYEAERRTIGTPTYKADSDNEGRKLYFAKENRRFPYRKLLFKAKKETEHVPGSWPETMSLFTLLYPSPSLTKLFRPVSALNKRDETGQKLKLNNLVQEIAGDLEGQLDELKNEYPAAPGKTGLGWYWAAPLLIDIANGYGHAVSNWIDRTIEHMTGNSKEVDTDTPEIKHLRFLQKVAQGKQRLALGPMQKDLTRVLAWQVLASPAVSSLRMMQQNTLPDYATAELPVLMRDAYRLGKGFMRLFNSPEATAIVDITYGKKYDEQHWRNVLRYCMEGNLQAVLDEYRHMLVESYGLNNDKFSDQAARCCELMLEAMEASTASYKVDTLQSFLDSFKEEKKLSLRSHYAAGFFEIKSYEAKNVQRTDRLRSSFNSPFRPFVLATTSIGQEGLDFHYYCRKVLHWNLPGNPVELEQREGRVNRYKNIAIRQTISSLYSNIHFKEDPWAEMFAKGRESNEDSCELVPFWHLEANCTNENRFPIERIVPKYPYSRDEQQYERLIRLLSIYRVSLGQARQEELLEYILQNISSDEQVEDLKKLFMNLSPYYRKK